MRQRNAVIIPLCLILVACANSPARQLFQSDEQVAENLVQESTSSLCRLYLKGMRFYMESPTSTLAEQTYYRRNPIIKELLVDRGLPEDHCHDEVAINTFAEEIKHNRQKELARAVNSKKRVIEEDDDIFQTVREQNAAAACRNSGGLYTVIGSCL